jgi:choline monooxygenase
MSTAHEWSEWLDVDPAIERAWTPNAQIYADPGFFRTVADRLFARTWQVAGDRYGARVPGATMPTTLLPGLLDEPLLFTRDTEDHLHCLSNVCTHRGNQVVENAGVESYLRCRYHGRRFALDGSFVSMPEFDRAEGFPCEKDDLPRVPFANWGPILFASLDPIHPFEELIAPIAERASFLPLDEFVFDAGRSRDYLVKANWALYCENYLEGFHVPFVHAGLADELDYGAYSTELFPWASLQLGVSKGGDEVFGLPADSPNAGQPIAAYYFFLFPGTMVNLYPWGLSLNIIQPLAVDRTKVSFRTWVWKPELLNRGAGAELDRVEREDEAIVEAVQVGVRSRLYHRGRYSPDREQCVHHFHRLLASCLASEPVAASA